MAGSTGSPPEGACPGSLIGELRVIEGADAGRTIALGEGAVIGRDRGADVVLADGDGQVSRHHARISLQSSGAMLEDPRSTNGDVRQWRASNRRPPTPGR